MSPTYYQNLWVYRAKGQESDIRSSKRNFLRWNHLLTPEKQIAMKTLMKISIHFNRIKIFFQVSNFVAADAWVTCFTSSADWSTPSAAWCSSWPESILCSNCQFFKSDLTYGQALGWEFHRKDQQLTSNFDEMTIFLYYAKIDFFDFS